MSIGTRIVDNPEDREEIFVFRYSIYVTGLGGQKAYGDRSRRRIEESLEQIGSFSEPTRAIPWEGRYVITGQIKKSVITGNFTIWQ